MHPTPEKNIIEKINKQKQYFATHKTKDIKFRLEKLHILKKAILQYEKQIEQALWQDLHKSAEEAFLTEISIVLNEIDLHIKKLKKWVKHKKVSTPLHIKPSLSKIIYEPLGVSLIVSPWNYPFNLLISPLIGSISAGCCAVLKPSPEAPHFAKVIKNMIADFFEEKYITVVQGGKETNTILFSQKFDIIFFTGSPKVGKVVMKSASEHLTPVVLELGGKSPCIVDNTANIKIAAKRIAWGKLINAGQTCVAPDYLFVHKAAKDELLTEIVKQIKNMFGKEPKQSQYYPRIITEESATRLFTLIENSDIYFGGEIDIKNKYISPTIINNVDINDPIMQKEIFAPILPVITFENLTEVLNYVNSNEKPLALYYFGTKQNAKKILNNTSSGGACINDTVMHLANHNLPFGGVGNSGMGKYHGKESFLAFSNQKAVTLSPTFIDMPFRYVPFRYFNLVKKILK